MKISFLLLAGLISLGGCSRAQKIAPAKPIEEMNIKECRQKAEELRERNMKLQLDQQALLAEKNKKIKELKKKLEMFGVFEK